MLATERVGIKEREDTLSVDSALFGRALSLGRVINDSEQMRGIKRNMCYAAYAFRYQFRLVIRALPEPLFVEWYRNDKVNQGEPAWILRDKGLCSKLSEHRCKLGLLAIFESVNDIIEVAALLIVAEGSSFHNFGDIGKEP